MVAPPTSNLIDLTGPPRPWPRRLRERFADAQSRALAAADCWTTPAPGGDRQLLDRLGELFGAPAGRTLVVGGVRQFAAAWAGVTPTSWVEAPSFSDVPAILAVAGRGQRGDWRTLHGRIPRGTVWVTDPYRNPDGGCLGPDVRELLATLAGERHPVVVNQVYRWYLPSGTAPAVPAGAWSVTSLAKFFGGGSRIGWAVAPEGAPVPPALLVAGPAKPWQRAWAAFLDVRTIAQMRTACIEPTLAARAAFVAHIRDLAGWEFVGGGPSVHLRCDGVGEQHIVEALRGAGVRVSPGAAFDAPAPSVRLAFSGTDEAGARAAAERIARLSPVCGLNPW